MKKLDDVSTRELLETLKRRGLYVTPDDHLAKDAEHLLGCLASEILDYPFQNVTAR